MFRSDALSLLPFLDQFPELFRLTQRLVFAQRQTGPIQEILKGVFRQHPMHQDGMIVGHLEIDSDILGPVAEKCLPLADLAIAKVGQLLVVEPHVRQLPEKLQGLPGIEWVSDVENAIERADIVLLLVNHRVFGGVNRRLLDTKVVIDTRGLWR